MSTTAEKSAPIAEPAPKPNGPAAAALVAGGIGGTFYGLLIVLVEASPAFKTLMTINKGVGPLSGKTTFGVIGWLVAWAILGNLWKGKEVNLSKVWQVTVGLIVLSLLLTFPPVFQLFTVH
jgi:hypothetical protein